MKASLKVWWHPTPIAKKQINSDCCESLIDHQIKCNHLERSRFSQAVYWPFHQTYIGSLHRTFFICNHFVFVFVYLADSGKLGLIDMFFERRSCRNSFSYVKILYLYLCDSLCISLIWASRADWPVLRALVLAANLFLPPSNRQSWGSHHLPADVMQPEENLIVYLYLYKSRWLCIYICKARLRIDDCVFVFVMKSQE